MGFRYITVKEAATIVSMNPETVYRAIRRGELPAYKRRRLTRIREDHLDRWMDGFLIIDDGFCPNPAETDG